VCGRFVSVSSPQLLVERFGVEETAVETRQPDYNVTPRATVPIVRERPPRNDHTGSAKRVLTLVRWGLVPSWAESTAIGDRLINARAETIAEKAAYKRAFARRRCIVPADAFYEWRRLDEKTRQPYLIHHPDGSPLAFAGLWSAWKDEANDAWLHSCTIITTAANEAMLALHDRMPVVLPRSAWDRWLDPTVTDAARLQALLHASAAGELEAYPVSTAVNSPRNKGPELARPIAGPVLPA
jgi:putative SOS response-associated peptidase YedK